MAITIEICEADILSAFLSRRFANNGAEYITAENKLWNTMTKLAVIIDMPIEAIWVNGSGVTENVSTMTSQRLSSIEEAIISQQAKATMKIMSEQNDRLARNLTRMDSQLKYIKEIRETR